jgi:hypothetical protein
MTFLCPVDLLLQRIGRLHRFKDTNRPVSLKEPEAEIIYQFINGQPCVYVYDMYRMEMTKQAVKNISVLKTPDDVEKLVNFVYECKTKGKKSKFANDFRKKNDVQEQKAKNIEIVDPQIVINPMYKNDLDDNAEYSMMNDDGEQKLTKVQQLKTRDINFTMKVIVVFNKYGKQWLDKDATIPFVIKKEYSPEEIEVYTDSTCPIIGNPLFYIFKQTIEPKWKHVRNLRNYGILMLDENSQQILSHSSKGATSFITCSYDKELGFSQTF